MSKWFTNKRLGTAPIVVRVLWIFWPYENDGYKHFWVGGCWKKWWNGIQGGLTGLFNLRNFLGHKQGCISRLTPFH